MAFGIVELTCRKCRRRLRFTPNFKDQFLSPKCPCEHDCSAHIQEVIAAHPSDRFEPVAA